MQIQALYLFSGKFCFIWVWWEAKSPELVFFPEVAQKGRQISFNVFRCLRERVAEDPSFFQWIYSFVFFFLKLIFVVNQLQTQFYNVVCRISTCQLWIIWKTIGWICYNHDISPFNFTQRPWNGFHRCPFRIYYFPSCTESWKLCGINSCGIMIYNI